MNESFSRGVRLGVPYAAVGLFLALSFGVLARQAGFSVAQTIVCSLIVFAGSAQFAVLPIVIAGGGIGAAVATGGMMNSRFLAMGIALAPSLPGGPLKRALQAQPIVDVSWVLANRGDGTFDHWLMFGSTLPQYISWSLGTVIGAFAGDIINTEQFGFDAIFPAFFLALLFGEMRDRRSRAIAIAGALIALALVPFAPAGVPVLAASAAALIGLGR